MTGHGDRWKAVSTAVAMFALAVLVAPHHAQAQAVADRLGCTHMTGKYAFTQGDYLNEGATQILRTGMRVIKVSLSSPAGCYPFNSTWPPFYSLTQIAQHPYYQALFSKPFNTYILTTYSFVDRNGSYWVSSVTPDQIAAEHQQFYELTKYFLTAYRGTGKTFVLQHWEGDWSLRGTADPSPAYDAQPPAIQHMIDWLNARQDGVNQARAEVTDTNVKVYHATEVNCVEWAIAGRPMVANKVLPYTHCDLCSYSSWDAISASSASHFKAVLDYLASNLPPTVVFGNKSIYIGEFGWPEKYTTSMNIIRAATQGAMDWGCPWLLFWQVYDNECTVNPASNADCPGYWMFRRDGSVAPSHDYFVSLINSLPLGVNVARTATTVTTDSSHSSAEVGSKAIDGITASNSKWTSTNSSQQHWLALDLGKMREVHTFVVRHVGAGGETPSYNTRNFSIQSATSLSGPWTDEFAVDNSVDQYNLTLRSYFSSKSLRYVRLFITNPGSDRYARIPEFEVWGDNGTAAFSVSPPEGKMPLTVQFTDRSTGNVDTWEWDFGDGGTSNLPSPVHTYLRPGRFAITLSVTGVSARSQATQTVRVRGADFDGDGDVDQADFGLLQRCLSDEATPQTDPACVAAQLDSDDDVDGDDLVIFLACMNGANLPPLATCAFSR